MSHRFFGEVRHRKFIRVLVLRRRPDVHGKGEASEWILDLLHHPQVGVENVQDERDFIKLGESHICNTHV